MRCQIPIVYYHSVGNTPLSVKVDNFITHMSYLKNNNFTTILFKDLVNKNYKESNKNVVITFDDCFLDVYENALPIIKEFGFIATFFATLGYDNITLWGSQEGQRWNTKETDSFNIPYGFMNSKHRAELINLGMEIGSHTVNHFNLDELNMEEMTYEIRHSKQILESELGISIDTFCYPRGKYDCNSIKMVRQEYKGACVTQTGYYDDSNSQYEVLRFGVGNDNNYFYDIVDNKLDILRYRIIRKLKNKFNFFK